MLPSLWQPRLVLQESGLDRTYPDHQLCLASVAFAICLHSGPAGLESLYLLIVQMMAALGQEQSGYQYRPMDPQGTVTIPSFFLFFLKLFPFRFSKQLLQWSRKLTQMHKKSRWTGTDQVFHLYLGAPSPRSSLEDTVSGGFQTA